MKLYEIFNELITNNIKLLTESVSDTDVIDAIENKYNVKIKYDDPGRKPQDPPSQRYIQVYNYSDTSANNKAIRAFQIFGDSRTTREGSWKIFRLDRIIEWTPTKVKWKKPVSDLSPNIPTYNKNGDNSMNRVYNKVNIDNINVSDANKKKNNSRELTNTEKKLLKKDKPDLFKPKKPESSYSATGDPKPNKEIIDKEKKDIDGNTTTS